MPKSLASSLKLDDGDGDNKYDEVQINARDPAAKPDSQSESDHRDNGQPHSGDPESSDIASRGVKEDLSEISKTLTRQFWGVASFLAPPPPSSDPQNPISDNGSDASDPAGISGIRSDFAEIGGKFRTGISKLSSNKAVSGITKMASNLLQLGSDEHGSVEEYVYAALGVVGITDEVVFFVRNISMHPGTWLDFPLPDKEHIDFYMSDIQQKHVLAVEHLAPRLADLRVELCPRYMSEGCFWKIYFMLLYPKLNAKDAELLSTPQIMEARALLQNELHTKNKARPKSEGSGTGRSAFDSKEAADSQNQGHSFVPPDAQFQHVPPRTAEPESAIPTLADEFEVEKHPMPDTASQSVVEAEPVNQTNDHNAKSGSLRASDENYEVDDNDWLNEEDNVEAHGIGGVTVPIENEDDVSFSDLEEDDGDAPATKK